jgi:hypothetical protein
MKQQNYLLLTLWNSTEQVQQKNNYGIRSNK